MKFWLASDGCPHGPFFFDLYKGVSRNPAPDCNLSVTSLDDAVRIGVNFVQALIGLAGIVAVFVLAFAGITYMLSAGQPQETAKAKNLIMNAVIGLVAAASITLILNFVTARLLP